MKFLLNIFKSKGKQTKKGAPNANDYKQEVLVKYGREQFKALIKKGLSIPVTLL